jgi:hypothetical protein
MNTEGFPECWNLSYISVHSLLPISADMWNIPIWSANYFVCHYFIWRTEPPSRLNCTALCGGEALWRRFLCDTCSRKVLVLIRCLHPLSYSPLLCWQAVTDRTLSAIKKLENLHKSRADIHGTIDQNCHLLTSVSPNTNWWLARNHWRTLHAPEVPCEVYLSTRAFICSWWSSAHSRSMRGASSICIWTSDFP